MPRQTARNGAQIQRQDKSIATRVPEMNSTRINFIFGDPVISGILNDPVSAKTLIQKPPMSQYAHDFCGIAEVLPYKKDEKHYGCLSGDLDYVTDDPYLTILYEYEENSEQYRDQVNIGVITCPIEEIAALSGSYDELAQ